MNTKSNLFAVIIGTIILAQIGWAQNKRFIFYGLFDECEGKDSGNYTRVGTMISNADCSLDSFGKGFSAFIQNGPKGEKTFIAIQELAGSIYPAGVLLLFTSGSLAGNYGMIKAKHLLPNYLKMCSSVLGLSFFTVKAQLLISDKLDPNVLISPTGAYDLFKKGCTTICNGKYWAV